MCHTNIKKLLVYLSFFTPSLFAQDVSGAAQTYNITTFAVPGASETTAVGISEGGVVVGTFSSGAAGATFCFLRAPDGTFTTLSPPGATQLLTACSITSQGKVFGYYTVAPNIYQSFSYQDGEYQLLSINGQSTRILGGNDNGAVTGEYSTYSFLYRPGKALTQLQGPGQQITEGVAINDNGALVGLFYDDYGEQQDTYGFELIGDKYVQINVPPGIYSTMPSAINDKGVIVGTYLPKDTHYHGFIYQDGTYRDFYISGSLGTYLFGLNSQGALTGLYQDVDNNLVSL